MKARSRFPGTRLHDNAADSAKVVGDQTTCCRMQRHVLCLASLAQDLQVRHAAALRLQNAALTQNRDVLELRRIEVEQTKAERWNGALPTSVYAGTPILFFNPQSGK